MEIVLILAGLLGIFGIGHQDRIKEENRYKDKKDDENKGK